MPANTAPFVVAVLHELGLLVLAGSLFFVLNAILPAISEVRSPRLRIRLRRGTFRRMFLWGWLGLTLLWATALTQLVIHGHSGWPAHVVVMAGLSLVFTLLFLFAQFALQMQVIVALEDGNSERAAWLLHWLSRVLALALLIALAVVVLDVAGPALIP